MDADASQEGDEAADIACISMRCLRQHLPRLGIGAHHGGKCDGENRDESYRGGSDDSAIDFIVHHNRRGFGFGTLG